MKSPHGLWMRIKGLHSYVVTVRLMYEVSLFTNPRGLEMHHLFPISKTSVDDTIDESGALNKVGMWGK